MPLLRLTLTGPMPTPAQATSLQSGLTTLMAECLHKRADLTVLTIAHQPSGLWSAGGRALPEADWSASLEVFITAGSNTTEERAAFIAAAHSLIATHRTQPPHGPLYILVNEVDARSWGYDGQTQQARRTPPAARSSPLPTLWALSGQATPAAPPAQGSALLLIDFQRDYEDGGALPLSGMAQAVARAQALVLAAERAGVPVVHVHHEARSASAALLAPGSIGAQAVAALPVRPGQHQVIKHWPSSFKDTHLAALLHTLSARHLVLAGCMTHNCVDSTAREAMHLGYAVTVVGDACATRSLPGIDGTDWPAEQVHHVSLSALADRHAHILQTEDITAAWQQPA